ncbi:threonine synthase [Natranaerovirga pectinivora]|uniref:Threonine synthase n=1 Tax=Natranaerovirga pectinivora TaxID=682400 RepID=A0A4R3MNC9_9FIRM|nr:threonine synthase [Natranaerovirga pectinivora]TCT15544.1 threonine synthase [Natranaerovirga pectinivora]
MNNILYKSTRGLEKDIEASKAILKGLAEDGGLFVPETIPSFDIPLDDMINMTYQELAYEIMKLYFTDFTEEELKDCINKAYDSKFDTSEIAPLVKKDNVYYLELFHGSTIAFKDMALSILPHLMTTAAKKNNIENEIVILTATSGDTGKAALAGFADVKDTKIIVFYPKEGVSDIQERQMITQKGDNTFVIGIQGNFDDAQNGVKDILNDINLRKIMRDTGYQFSSANSINIGRLVPQIVYYVYAYAQLVKNGDIKIKDKINAVVPTGNFGNILAAYYAKQMGLPINRLICASNDNKVLFDFFKSGTYDKNRPFVLTSSPSMDILISSNLERLIYLLTDESSEKTKELMESLSKAGAYSIDPKMKEKVTDFYGQYSTEEETAHTIKKVFDTTDYLIDPHTAVGVSVYHKYVKETSDETKTVVASTASPYKFTRSVMLSLDEAYNEKTDFELIDIMHEKSNVAIPQAIEDIRHAEVLHKRVCDYTEMKDVVKDILKLV